jgi:uncharacterized protein
MKICILSDSHDHVFLLDAAVADAKAVGAELVLHCGDVVAPSSLKCLSKHGLPVHVIHGNNTGDLYALGRLAARPDRLIHYHGMDVQLELAERRIFMVHYPHYARALAATGNWDLVCCGHSHQAEREIVQTMQGCTTILINPGTVGGVGGQPVTYVLGDLTTMEFSLRHMARLGAPGQAIPWT